VNEKPERIKLVRSHTMKSLRLCESHQFSGSVVKRFLSIFSALILNSGVDRGMPNLAAAPRVQTHAQSFLLERPQ